MTRSWHRRGSFQLSPRIGEGPIVFVGQVMKHTTSVEVTVEQKLEVIVFPDAYPHKVLLKKRKLSGKRITFPNCKVVVQCPIGD